MTGSDMVDLVSMIGTWVGCLLTTIGLLAVITQLRQGLRVMKYDRKEATRRAAGRWYLCMHNTILPASGVVEAVLPAFGGWLQDGYRNEKRISITQTNRGTSGTSSWSKMFARLSIMPTDLVNFGGPQATVFASSANIYQPVLQADLNVQKGRLLYGFSKAEFAALMILSGISPTQLSPNREGAAESKGFLGQIQIAHLTPFSQVAFFDPYDRASTLRDMPKDIPRYTVTVPIHEAINLALSVLKVTSSRGCVLLPDQLPRDASACEPFTRWGTAPSASYADAVRFHKEQMIKGQSGSEFWQHTVRPKVGEANNEAIISYMFTHFGSNAKIKWHEAMTAAQAIDALVPWAVLPVTSRQVSLAFQEVLSPFVGTREETVYFLVEKISRDAIKPPEGWQNCAQFVGVINKIGDVKASFFGNSNTCQYYYEAMQAVFSAEKLNQAQVRRALAVQVAEYILTFGYTSPAKSIEDRQFRDDVGRWLGFGHTQAYSVPPWAIRLFATFIWGWFGGAILCETDLFGGLRRRIYVA